MIVVVFGLPGTGKSHFARLLADTLDAVYLGTDVEREKLGERGRYTPEAKQRVYGALLEKMAAAAGSRDVVVDGTFHERSRRNLFRRRAIAGGQRIRFIEMAAERETVERRLARDRPHSEADRQVHDKLAERFEPMREPHLHLWSDKLDPAEMAAAARRYIDG